MTEKLPLITQPFPMSSVDSFVSFSICRYTFPYIVTHLTWLNSISLFYCNSLDPSCISLD